MREMANLQKHIATAPLVGVCGPVGAPGDKLYDLSDMRRLAARYEDWRGGWDRCPVVDVDTTSTDLRRPEEIDKLAARVRIQLGSR